MGQSPSAVAQVTPVTVYDPERSVTTFAALQGAITGSATNNTANMLLVWDPTPGRKFRLKGFHIYVTVQADLVTTANAVHLFDSESGVTGVPATDLVWPLTSWFVSPAAGTQLAGTCDPVHIPSGRLSRAVNNNLYIGTSINMTSGTIYLNGVVWGTEE